LAANVEKKLSHKQAADIHVPKEVENILKRGRKYQAEKKII
jgi:hypothetical protein